MSPEDVILEAVIKSVDTKFHFGSRGVSNGVKRRKHVRAWVEMEVGGNIVRICSDTKPELIAGQLVKASGAKLSPVPGNVLAAAALRAEELEKVFIDAIIESPIPAEETVAQARKERQIKEELRKLQVARVAALRALGEEIAKWNFTREEVLEVWKSVTVRTVMEA